MHTIKILKHLLRTVGLKTLPRTLVSKPLLAQCRPASAPTYTASTLCVTENTCHKDDIVRFYSSDSTHLTIKPETKSNINDNIIKDANKEETSSLVSNRDETEVSIASMLDDIDLSEVRPAPRPVSLSLAPYVNTSTTLSMLVQLGVSLAAVDKHPAIADKLVQSDFERDIKPYLMFLHDIGVEDSNLGMFLTKNPFILTQDMDHLHTRIRYLKSKSFSDEAIATIVQKSPMFLNCSTVDIDTKLGYFQKEFQLTGEEVRQVLVTCPRVVRFPLIQYKYNTVYMREACGFNQDEMKQMVIYHPKILQTTSHKLMDIFDYVHNTMGIPHELISHWCMILRTRLEIIKPRHEFLVHLSRAQYDPTQPHYVSVKAIVVPSNDSVWCDQVARASIQQYDDFLRTR